MSTEEQKGMRQVSTETLRHGSIIKLVLTVCPFYVPNLPIPPYLLWFAAGVHGDKEDLHDPLVADRQWDTEVAEGVKGHRHIATIRAHQCGLEEAVESVHNHRIVPSFVVLPGLLSDLLLTASWWVVGLSQGRGNHGLGWICMGLKLRLGLLVKFKGRIIARAV